MRRICRAFEPWQRQHRPGHSWPSVADGIIPSFDVGMQPAVEDSSSSRETELAVAGEAAAADAAVVVGSGLDVKVPPSAAVVAVVAVEVTSSFHLLPHSSFH